MKEFAQKHNLPLISRYDPNNDEETQLRFQQEQEIRRLMQIDLQDPKTSSQMDISDGPQEPQLQSPNQMQLTTMALPKPQTSTKLKGRETSQPFQLPEPSQNSSKGKKRNRPRKPFRNPGLDLLSTANKQLDPSVWKDPSMSSKLLEAISSSHNLNVLRMQNKMYHRNRSLRERQQASTSKSTMDTPEIISPPGSPTWGTNEGPSTRPQDIPIHPDYPTWTDPKFPPKKYLDYLEVVLRASNFEDPQLHCLPPQDRHICITFLQDWVMQLHAKYMKETFH
jgi:hypothetical protein